MRTSALALPFFAALILTIAAFSSLGGAQPSQMPSSNSQANDTQALTAKQRRAVKDHILKCWVEKPGAVTVELSVTTDETGRIRRAEVARDKDRLGDANFLASAEEAVRAVLDPRCAKLPLPAGMLGDVRIFALRFGVAVKLNEVAERAQAPQPKGTVSTSGSPVRDAIAQGSPAPVVPRGAAGPSFPCPSPRDPLAQLICDDPTLSLLDLAFTQAHQALRQQIGESGQLEIRREADDFGRAVRGSCGIAVAQSATSTAPLPPAAPPGATTCVTQAYSRQKSLLQARLSGAAAEEALRPFADQLAVQRDLQRLKFLPETLTIDGIFGSATRAAISAWQNASNRTVTGFIGKLDEQALHQAADAQPPASVTTPPVNAIGAVPDNRVAESERVQQQDAQSDLLPLKRGTYVSSDTPCNMAANATSRIYDGRYFSAGHDLFSNCAPRVKEKKGSAYVVSRLCPDGGGDEATYIVHGVNAYDLNNQYGTFRFRLCQPANEQPSSLTRAEIGEVIGLLGDLQTQCAGNHLGNSSVLDEQVTTASVTDPDRLYKIGRSMMEPTVVSMVKAQLSSIALRNCSNPLPARFRLCVPVSLYHGISYPSGCNSILFLNLRLRPEANDSFTNLFVHSDPEREWNQLPNYVALVESGLEQELQRKTQEAAANQAAAAREAARDRFNKKFQVDQWANRDDIIANPFRFKDRVIGVRANFIKMTGEHEAVFGDTSCGGGLCNNSLLLGQVPTTLFTGGENLVLAVKVNGTRVVKGSSETTMPDLDLVGHYLCKRSDCGDFLDR